MDCTKQFQAKYDNREADPHQHKRVVAMLSHNSSVSISGSEKHWWLHSEGSQKSGLQEFTCKPLECLFDKTQ